MTWQEAVFVALGCLYLACFVAYIIDPEGFSERPNDDGQGGAP